MHNYRAAFGSQAPRNSRAHRSGVRQEGEERKMILASHFSRAGLRAAPTGLLLAPALASFLSFGAGCRIASTTAPERTAEARAEDLLLCSDPEASLAAFHQMLSASRSPEDKAKAYLGMARAHLRLRSYRNALDCLYPARRHYDLGPLRGMTEKLLGEAAFLNQDYGLARGYLEKSLESAGGEERNRVLVQLHICAMKSLDSQNAARYLQEARKPLSP